MAMFGPKQFVPCLFVALGVGVLTQPVASREPAKAAPENPTQLINRTLVDAWKQNKATPPRKTTDAEFARKLYLDLTGRAPTAGQVTAFEKEKAADKRAKLVAQLLGEKDFANHLANLWTENLLPEKYNRGYRDEFRKWLAAKIAAGTPYDDIVKAMLTATGKTTDNGSVHFILANLGNPLPEDKRADAGQFDMAPVTAQTGRVFLGLGFQCLACHSHPFEASLRQRDFWGINAFFRQAERVGEPCDGVAVPLELKDNPKLNVEGIVRFKRRTGFMDATGMNLLKDRSPREDDRSRRAILAEFVVKHKNFAPVAVNRTWQSLLGRGLLENGTMEEMGDFNEPLYPELLAGLATAFRESGCDQKKLIAWICESDVYQLHTTPGEDDDRNFFRKQIVQAAAKLDPDNPCSLVR